MKYKLHLGHIGLLDAAPLLIAQERGYFAAENLDVTLSCELGLATVCGKLADRRMDGACLPAPLPILLNLGAGVPRVAMHAVAWTCWQGFGVVLAAGRGPARAGSDPGAACRLGVIAPGTPTRLLLHRLAQISPGALPVEHTQVPMAASQLIEFLREGMLDGFCGIDPLPALARVITGSQSVTDSAALFPLHPGGVVALRADRAEQNPGVVAALERALIKARAACADPVNRDSMWALVLAQAPYAELDEASRAGLLAVVDENRAGWMSTCFATGAGEREHFGAAAEIFLENACRGAAGAAGRALDIKAEIARVYPRRAVAISR